MRLLGLAELVTEVGCEPQDYLFVRKKVSASS